MKEADRGKQKVVCGGKCPVGRQHPLVTSKPIRRFRRGNRKNKSWELLKGESGTSVCLLQKSTLRTPGQFDVFTVSNDTTNI